MDKFQTTSSEIKSEENQELYIDNVLIKYSYKNNNGDINQQVIISNYDKEPDLEAQYRCHVIIEGKNQLKEEIFKKLSRFLVNLHTLDKIEQDNFLKTEG